MKSQQGKSFRRQLRRPDGLIFLAAAMLCFAAPLHAQADAVTPPAGGPGGSPFVARCPQRQYLTGFEIRGGALVDAIRPMCVAVYGPAEPAPLVPWPRMIGGPGGSARQLLCPREFPIVKTLTFGWKLRDPSVIQDMELVCGTAAAREEKEQFDAGPGPTFFGSDYSPYRDPENPAQAGAIQSCANPSDEFHGASVGITGRSGEWLDALGLICVPAVEFTPKPVALGRIEPSSSPPLKTLGGEPPICARARDARARNSPVAQRLETACRAAGGSFMDRKVTPADPDTSARNAVAQSHPATVAPSPAERYESMRVTPATGMPGSASRAAAYAPSPAARAAAPPALGFAPPVFVGGARLWACFDAAHAETNGAPCKGLEAGEAFCRQQGFSGVTRTGAEGVPALKLASVRPGTPVRAVNGDTCMANNCAVVSELHCAR